MEGGSPWIHCTVIRGHPLQARQGPQKGSAICASPGRCWTMRGREGKAFQEGAGKAELEREWWWSEIILEGLGW